LHPVTILHWTFGSACYSLA